MSDQELLALNRERADLICKIAGLRSMGAQEEVLQARQAEVDQLSERITELQEVKGQQ